MSTPLTNTFATMDQSYVADEDDELATLKTLKQFASQFQQPVINTVSLPDAVWQDTYDYSLSVSGTPNSILSITAGTSPISMSAAGHFSGNVISQSMIGAGVPFTVTAHNGVGADYSKVFSITVNCRPVCSTLSLPNAVPGSAYSQQLSILAYPEAYCVLQSGALPAGLTISSSGLISGTPIAPYGTFAFTVRVTNTIAGVDYFSDVNLSINFPRLAPADFVARASILAGPQILLDWDPSNGAVSYTVFRDLVPYSPVSNNVLSQLITDALSSGSTYALFVRAKDSTGNYFTDTPVVSVTLPAAAVAEIDFTDANAAPTTGPAYTLTRSTAKWFQDASALLHEILPGELFFEGAFRRCNYLTNAQPFTTHSVALKAGPYLLSMHDPASLGTNSGTITVTGGTASGVCPTNGYVQFFLDDDATVTFTASGGASIAAAMCLRTTDSVPPAYVSKGVAVAPLYHGAYVDGVRYDKNGSNDCGPCIWPAATNLCTSNPVKGFDAARQNMNAAVRSPSGYKTIDGSKIYRYTIPNDAGTAREHTGRTNFFSPATGTFPVSFCIGKNSNRGVDIWFDTDTGSAAQKWHLNPSTGQCTIGGSFGTNKPTSTSLSAVSHPTLPIWIVTGVFTVTTSANTFVEIRPTSTLSGTTTNYADDGSGFIEASHVMVEVGVAEPSPFCIGTVNADDLEMVPTGTYYTSAEHTIFVDCKPSTRAGARSLVSIDGNSNNNIHLYADPGNNFYAHVGTLSKNVGTFTPGIRNKFAFSVKSGAHAGSVNGNLVTDPTATTGGAGTNLIAGASPTKAQYLCGTIYGIKLYASPKLSDSGLPALTTGGTPPPPPSGSASILYPADGAVIAPDFYIKVDRGTVPQAGTSKCQIYANGSLVMEYPGDGTTGAMAWNNSVAKIPPFYCQPGTYVLQAVIVNSGGNVTTPPITVTATARATGSFVGSIFLGQARDALIDTGRFNSALSHSKVAGFMMELTWAQTETSNGVYDFSKVTSNLTTVEGLGKKLMLAPWFLTYQDSDHTVPLWARQTAAYGQGYNRSNQMIAGQYGESQAMINPGTQIHLWDPDVMAKVKAWYTALAAVCKGRSGFWGVKMGEMIMQQLTSTVNAPLVAAYGGANSYANGWLNIWKELTLHVRDAFAPYPVHVTTGWGDWGLSSSVLFSFMDWARQNDLGLGFWDVCCPHVSPYHETYSRWTEPDGAARSGFWPSGTLLNGKTERGSSCAAEWEPTWGNAANGNSDRNTDMWADVAYYITLKKISTFIYNPIDDLAYTSPVTSGPSWTAFVNAILNITTVSDYMVHNS